MLPNAVITMTGTVGLPLLDPAAPDLPGIEPEPSPPPIKGGGLSRDWVQA
jgi:hypothetical protein